jgi:preprotein translocase subunit SecE
VARDRKRAKRRRDRRGTTAGGRVEGAHTAPQSLPIRADLPGALDHASGEVDEFDAALVRGAGGVTATPESGLEGERGSAEPEAGTELAQAQTDLEESGAVPAEAGAAQPSELRAPVAGASATGAAPAEPVVVSKVEVGDGAQEALARPGSDGGAGGGRGGGGRGGGDGAEGDRDQPPAPRLRGLSRAAAFLQASWSELQRVQWPDRRQVTQATAVVLGFVAIAGAYLGVADYVAKEIVEFIL